MKRLIHLKRSLTLGLMVRSISAVLAIALGCAGLSACRKSSLDPTSTAKDPESVERERGAQVVAEYLRRDAAPYRQARARVTVSGANQSTQVYELEVSRKQSTDETLSLTQVVEPGTQRNVASLTTERQGTDAVNLTYITANDQFRETGTDKSFFGGVTAQEFLGEWDKYEPRLLSEKDLDGTRSYEIEARLKPNRKSIITRVTAVFRGDTYLPSEMHAFNSDGQELRTFRMTDYRAYSGHTVVGRMEIENHIFKTTVVVEVLNMTFPEKMDDALFTREHLKKLTLG